MTKIIGLTGGIGSGKSTVAHYIASKGIPVYIADAAAKEIMEQPDVMAQIKQIFHQNVMTSEGKLDRKVIGQLVFTSPELLKKLNAIVHPLVKTHFIEWLQQHKTSSFVLKEVAILFESGGNKECDKVILVTAPEAIRIQRTMLRDKISQEAILNRIQNQLSDAEKIQKSDFVISNIDIKETYSQTDEILKILSKL
ncbi:dephospho-CoA kinase [Flavobacterium sp.]|jgi:dephospho-CoA kinase|uniref:dephospho-CoA kinase n=1 Tax=Flavobacterium sp. TaxID=239 RepID=UPI0037BFE3F8